MKPKKKRKYLASEWLRTCKFNGPQACHHEAAHIWFFGDYSVYQDDYQEMAKAAESAEFSERAIGLKPDKFYGKEP